MLDAGLDVAAVFTQPDRPSGRGMKLTPSPVKALATARGIAVHQPVKIRKCHDLLASIDPELIVVAAYGRLLPDYILDYPPYGCINLHASLLPRWRGAAPIQRAIQAGDTVGGVCTMYMASEMDAGDIIYTAETPITDDDTGGTLHDRYAVMGGELLVKTIHAIARGDAPRTPQNASLVTFCPPIDKSEARIDWSKPASDIRNLIRAFNPYPAAFTLINGEPVKVFAAALSNGTGEPGEVLRADTTLEVAASRGSLIITELQPASKRRMSAADFLHGNKIEKGTILGR